MNHCMKDSFIALRRISKNVKSFGLWQANCLEAKNLKRPTNLSCLCSMFNFAFGFNFLPPYVNKEDLVEKYMMTLVKYLVDHEQDNSHIIGGFFPEGVLNFLSAYYFANGPESLALIIDSSVKYGLCDMGNFGEQLAQYFLLEPSFFVLTPRLKRLEN